VGSRQWAAERIKYKKTMKKNGETDKTAEKMKKIIVISAQRQKK
jgi:hypothetical protein